jgi:hypothetical protein
MRTLIKLFLVVLLFCAFNQSIPKKLKGLKVFYHDTQTEKGKDIYRELTQLGEDPWAKPDKFDVALTVSEFKTTSERVEILIEELYEPTSLNKSKNGLQDKRWIPNKAIFSSTGKAIQMKNLVKNGKLILKDIPYAFTGFTDSMLYNKLSIRVVALYYDEDTKQFERLEREILIPE